MEPESEPGYILGERLGAADELGMPTHPGSGVVGGIGRGIGVRLLVHNYWCTLRQCET